MAVIQCGSLVSKIQGRVGTNIYYMHGKTQCVKIMPTTSSDPNTGPQQAIRGLVSSLSLDWANGTVTAGEKVLWNVYAKRSRQVSHMTGGVLNPRLKPDNILAGINSFIWTNVMLSRVGLATVDIPPLIVTPKPALLFQDPMAYADPTLTISWANAADYIGTKVLAHVSASKRIVHPQNLPAVDGDDGVITITDLNSLNGVAVPLNSIVPITLHCTLRYVMVDGFISAISNTESLLLN